MTPPPIFFGRSYFFLRDVVVRDLAPEPRAGLAFAERDVVARFAAAFRFEVEDEPVFFRELEPDVRGAALPVEPDARLDERRELLEPAAFSGLPFRLVEANSSSWASLMDSYIPRDAPLSAPFLVSPRLADRAAPAAFC
jgi:hypothetical protein